MELANSIIQSTIAHHEGSAENGTKAGGYLGQAVAEDMADYYAIDDERTLLCQLIDACNKVNSREAFAALYNNYVKLLIPHDYAAAGIGELDTAVPLYGINISYPDEYYKWICTIKTASDPVQCPVTRYWAKHPGLYLSNDLGALARDDPEWQVLARRFGVKAKLMNGVADIQGKFTSLIVLCSTSAKFSLEHKRIMALITPHLHAALARLYAHGQHHKEGEKLLTGREFDVLKFLNEGHANKDVAQMLNISVSTVKNHAHNIYRKLQANNRIQALARAKHLGLI